MKKLKLDVVSTLMDKEFLEDYEAQEHEEIKLFMKNVTEGKFSKNQRFPPENRFKKLHKPITYIGSTNNPIWPVIPFSGSTIVPLIAAKKTTFESLHKFSINQIEEMVTFSEDTGKIQFVLMDDPTKYIKLDFFDPIFERLRPPQFVGMPSSKFIKFSDVKRYSVEFSTLSSLGFGNYLAKKESHLSSEVVQRVYMRNIQGNYIMARALANPVMSEELRDALVTDYDQAMGILHVVNLLLLRPLRNPLKCTESYDLKTLKIAHRFMKARGINVKKSLFPREMGKLLMKKFTHYPESLEVCKYLVHKYEEQDLIRLFNVLNEGIMGNHPEIVEKTEKELSILLDNIWTDKSFSRKTTGIKFGIPLLIGAIGTVAAGLPGAFTGLLSAIGFNVLDKIFELNEESISKKIAKEVSKNHQVMIFDFKKKYSLTSK